MLSKQRTRQGNSLAQDRFYFRGGDITDNQKFSSINIHPQCKSHIQIHCKRKSERIVVLQGKGIPKKSDLENAEYYSLCILTLFKPWETVHDLRENYNSWTEAC
ncbi:hypothetical protein Glove_689g7 [Diversispora epigaea]|uniref:Uncharacterized protein n=1 Tax=Diversispora epigaea TaxID=1348612 RepID=A0A397GAL4_9GLOM|nr:hypothetical protein Glove_689g7 [Diversispora epigaea]